MCERIYDTPPARESQVVTVPAYFNDAQRLNTPHPINPHRKRTYIYMYVYMYMYIYRYIYIYVYIYIYMYICGLRSVQ